jgi:23S rRNA pseudouridine2605 synthase
MTNHSERIAKFIARAGVCSRRQAEVLISEGKVQVNGSIITEPGTKINTDDTIIVNGKPLLQTEKTRLWLFYKPRSAITSNYDPQGRKTIFEFLPKNMPRVITIGRLDYNTEGLLLLTNDGELARALELPKNQVIREYRVRIFGKLYQDVITKLAAGVTVEGINYASIIAEPETSEQRANTWIKVKLTEGKNREIRKVFSYFGLEVSRLIRTAYGVFSLKNLNPGEVREVEEAKVFQLKKQLNLVI